MGSISAMIWALPTMPSTTWIIVLMGCRNDPDHRPVHLAHTGWVKTRLTFTIEIPAREQIGALLDLERGLPFRQAQGLAEPEPAEGQQALHGIGQKVMTETLSRYDTEGEPIRFGSDAMTSEGRSPECSKTLFGEVALERHTYQSSWLGISSLFC